MGWEASTVTALFRYSWNCGPDPVGDVQELAKAIQEQLDRPEKQFFVQRVDAFSAQCAADGYVALLLEENR